MFQSNSQPDIQLDTVGLTIGHPFYTTVFIIKSSAGAFDPTCKRGIVLLNQTQ